MKAKFPGGPAKTWLLADSGPPFAKTSAKYTRDGRNLSRIAAFSRCWPPRASSPAQPPLGTPVDGPQRTPSAAGLILIGKAHQLTLTVTGLFGFLRRRLVRLARMVIAPDRNRIACRKSLVQRFIQLLVDILRGFFARVP